VVQDDDDDDNDDDDDFNDSPGQGDVEQQAQATRRTAATVRSKNRSGFDQDSGGGYGRLGGATKAVTSVLGNLSGMLSLPPQFRDAWCVDTCLQPLVAWEKRELIPVGASPM
jgi:hypothetical protein